MMAIKALTGGSSGVVEYMKATEYYRGEESEILHAPEWKGALKDEFGEALDGDPNKAFDNLLNGRSPDGAIKIAQNAGKPDRTMGWDLTLSADKTVSLAFATASPADRAKLMDAHRQAVDKAMEFITDECRARVTRNGVRSSEPVKGVIVRQVHHLDSRKGDPQLHTHCVLVNGCKRADGTFGAMDEEPILRAKHAAGAIYRHQLAQNLQALGYSLNTVHEMDNDGRHTGQVWHRVAGIDDETTAHFSKRRAQILEAMSDGLTAQEATLRTRQKKDADLTPAEICASAQRVMIERKVEGRAEWCVAEELKAAKYRPTPLPEVPLAERLNELHEQTNSSTFDRIRVIDWIAKNGVGQVIDPAREADRLIERWVNEQRLIPCHDEGQPGKWCTVEQLKREHGILADAHKRRHTQDHILAPEVVGKSIAQLEMVNGWKMSDEQKKAIAFVTQERGGLACISGLAGTGKTATSKAFIDAYKASGYAVVGVSTAQKAAKKLQEEAGIPSFSAAQLLADLASGKQTIQKNTLVIFDEAGMAGAKTLSQVQQAVDKAGAKLVLMGDALQLKPVEAGDPFRLLCKSEGEVKLTEIRRQQNEAERLLAHEFYGEANGRALLSKMEQAESLNITSDRDEAVARLARDYMGDQRAIEDKLIVTATHADGLAVTKAVREAMKAEGRITDSRAITVAGKLMGETRSIELGVGDRVRFTKNDKRLQVSNGDIATVTGWDKQGRAVLAVERDDGKPQEVRIDPNGKSRLDYAWTSTVHASQGQGKDAVFWLANSRSMDRNLGLVAFTRTKERFRGYMTEGDRGRIATKLDEWGKKDTAVEAARKAWANPKLDPVFQDRQRIVDGFRKAARWAMEPLRQAMQQRKQKQEAERLARAARELAERQARRKREREEAAPRPAPSLHDALRLMEAQYQGVDTARMVQERIKAVEVAAKVKGGALTPEEIKEVHKQVDRDALTRSLESTHNLPPPDRSRSLGRGGFSR